MGAFVGRVTPPTGHAPAVSGSSDDAGWRSVFFRLGPAQPNTESPIYCSVFGSRRTGVRFQRSAPRAHRRARRVRRPIGPASSSPRVVAFKPGSREAIVRLRRWKGSPTSKLSRRSFDRRVAKTEASHVSATGRRPSLDPHPDQLRGLRLRAVIDLSIRKLRLGFSRPASSSLLRTCFDAAKRNR